MKKLIRCFAAASLVLIMAALFPMSAVATTSTTSTTSTSAAGGTTTSTTLNISTSPSSSLGSITFKTSNSKRVEVGKSTYLYVTIKDMSGSVSTVFTCSNTSVASIEKINNTCIRVYGLKNGEVVITASAGGKSAKYTLIVGDASATGTSASQTSPDGTGATTASTTPIDLFANSESQLQEYIEQKKQNDSASIIIGVIGWAALIALFSVVLSVMFRNRSPKLNLYPGSRRRFNTGGYRGNQKKRLLPDHYYRKMKKY